DPTAGGQAGDNGGRADDRGQGDDLTDKGPADSASDTGMQIDPARRLFLARSLALVAGAAAAGTVGYGLWSQLSGPVIKHVTIPLGRLDPQIDGFRIAVLSDLHLGPILDRGYTERVVDAVNSHSPDLVTLVGDLVDGSVDELGPAVEPLRRLAAPHGAYFVTGNHEYYSGVTEWVDEIRELGVHPLRNEHTEIIGGRTAAFDLAGVNDATGGEYSPGEAPNYAAALRGRDPDQAVVLLAHQPVQVHDAARRGVDLQLSGHTHGGQLWPFHYAVRLQQPVVSGLARFDRTWLYVTSGVGSWGPPVRVGARPDITIVTLRSTR
ncbi:MAG: metallophosphoesterase, partial [Actinocatenispora sp.]